MRFTTRRRTAAVALTLSLGLALASCGSDGGGQPTPAAQPQAVKAPDVVAAADEPEAEKVVDVVREQLAKLDLTAGVFGAWRGDKEIVTGALGESPIDVPATRDMKVRVGQPMESMVSLVLLQLDKEGTVPLDQPISKWVPEFPRADQITPRMLADSTSGIADYVTDPEFDKRFYANPMQAWRAQDILGLATSRPPAFAPGASWAYAHSDLVLLGEVLEKASGKSVGELISQRILDPLGMDDSAVVTSPQMAEPALHGYTNERGVFEDSTFWNPTAFLNSGNMTSPVDEVGRWVRALGSGELLDAETHAAMMAPSTAGLGPLTEQKYFTFGSAHSNGWIVMNPAYGGYNGFALYEPATKTTVVVYVTLGPGADANKQNAQPIALAIGALMVPENPPAM